MTLEDFKASLDQDAPPADLAPALRALWCQAKGDWARAHKIVQGESDPASQWVHAHLHRAEGDQANAAYWYRRVAKAPSQAPLGEEWADIAGALLAAG